MILTDDVVIEGLLDLRRLDEPESRLGGAALGGGEGLHVAVDDRLADVNARVADVDAGTGDDLFSLPPAICRKKEHSVMREDLAMAKAWRGGRAGESRSEYYL